MTSPYFMFFKFWRFLFLSWLTQLVISLAVWHYQLLSYKVINIIMQTNLLSIYPALYSEFLQYVGLQTDQNLVDNLYIIFTIQAFALIIITIVHLIMLFRSIHLLRLDDVKIAALFLLSIFEVFFTGKITFNKLDFYNDYIDKIGVFIVKRTLLTSFLSYMIAVSVINGIAFFRGNLGKEN